MEKIDRTWILSRLTGKHGEKARLAEALGITTDKLSKILGGARELSGEETLAVLRYFNQEVALSPDQAAVFAAYEKLSPKRRAEVALFVDYLLSQEGKETDDPDQLG